MNLTVIEKTALEELSGSFRVLVQARLEKPFKRLENRQKTELCYNVVTLLHRKTGNGASVDAKILTEQTADLQAEIKGRFEDYTSTEIIMASEALYRGEYGSFFGLNAKTYHQMLKGFGDNIERGKAWLKYLEILEKPKVAEIPEHVKRAMSIESIQKRFLEFKKSGNLGFCAWATYDLIKQLKGVKSLITLSQFAEIKEKTISEWTEKYTSEMDRAKKKGNKTVAESIANILAVGVDKDETVLKRQKELALKMYFNSIDKLEI